jgi:hypothetical protein
VTETDVLVPGLTNGTTHLIEVRAFTTLGGGGPWRGVSVTPGTGILPYDEAVLADTPAVYYPLQDEAPGPLGEAISALHAGGDYAVDHTADASPQALQNHVYLDGINDYIALPESYTFDPTAGFALEGWFNIRGVSSYERLWDFANAASTSDIFIHRTGTSNDMYFYMGGAGATIAQYPAVGTWNHIVFSVEPTGATTVYINGVVAGTASRTLAAPGPRKNKWLGRSAYPNDAYSQMCTSRLAVYHHPLTAARVKWHYNLGVESATAPASAVTGLILTPLDQSIDVVWNAMTGVNEYEIRVNGGAPTLVAGTQTVLTGLTNGVSYLVEVRPLNSHGAGPWTGASATPIVTLLFDRFERANSTTSPGVPETGGPYTVRVGTFGINANRLYSVSAGNTQLTFPAAFDVDVRAKLGSSPNGRIGLMVRWANSTNYWMFWVADGAASIYRCINGTFTMMSQQSVRAWVVGDTARFVAVGRRLYGFYNDDLVTTVFDRYSSLAGTETEAGVRHDTANHYIDTLSAYPSYSGMWDSTGDLAPVAPSDFGAQQSVLQSFVYKGRNSKTDDTGSVA